MESIGYLIGVLIFLVFVALYFLYLIKPQTKKKGSASSLDLTVVTTRWKEVGQMLNLGGPANFKQAIIEADKLVDYVLKSRVGGETMGERLKSAKTLFSPNAYDDLWKAHKIRNRVVHEADTETLSFDAKTAVKNFEKALKELRVI